MSMTTEKMHCIKGPGCFLGDFPAVRRRNAEVPAENGHPAALVNSKEDQLSDVASNATVPPQPRAQGSLTAKGRKTETDEGIMGSLKNAVPQDGELSPKHPGASLREVGLHLSGGCGFAPCSFSAYKSEPKCFSHKFRLPSIFQAHRW